MQLASFPASPSPFLTEKVIKGEGEPGSEASMQSALVSRASDPLEEEAGSGRMRCLHACCACVARPRRGRSHETVMAKVSVQKV